MSKEIVLYGGFKDFIDRMAAERPDAIAFLHGANDRYHRVTWEAFAADVYARAEQLREGGKTCVAILADGSYASAVEIFAANIAGMQIAMLDVAVPDKMLAQLLPYVDADALWCSNEKRAEELSAFLTGPAADPTDKILFFTSGTTSRAKAVTLTSASLMASAYGGSGTFPLAAGDVLLCVLPLAHVFGFVCGLLWPWLCGATVALGRGGRHVFDDWTFYHPTATSVVPILLEHLLRRNLINPEHEHRTRMLHNDSRKFESGFVGLTIPRNESVMLGSLSGSRLGIWVAHGEGKFSLPEAEDRYHIVARYTYDAYPGNPNGSDHSVAGICSADGRHLAMMPHLERAIYPWQCGWYPANRRDDEVTPWIEAFVNARKWIEQHS